MSKESQLNGALQSRGEVRSQLTQALAGRILLVDGAMGTMIQRRGLSEADFRGNRFR